MSFPYSDFSLNSFNQALNVVQNWDGSAQGKEKSVTEKASLRVAVEALMHGAGAAHQNFT